MRNFFVCLLTILLTFGLMVNEASAKRFGGGRSFGVQRAKSSLYTSQTPRTTKSFNQRPNVNKWGGILGGLLVGSLLTSLFMGHGLGSGLLSWLIVGSLIFFVVSFLRKKMQPGYQAVEANTFTPYSPKSNPFQGGNTEIINNDSVYPLGFVPEVFLREAKISFIRLQTAYDHKNLQDLNEFTAPEVFAEIKMQLDERGDEPNKTEVIHLDAQLLDVSKQAGSTIASVHFIASLKENEGPVTEIKEIWHFRQFYPNSNWVVGGIQQEVFEPR